MIALVVPGNALSTFVPAVAGPPEEIVVDLGDSVAPDSVAKADARAAAVSVLASGEFDPQRVVVLINPLDSEWAQEDLAQLGGASVPPAAIVVPRATPNAIVAADVALADTSNSTTRLQALVQTADGLARVEHTAGASTRLEALVLDYATLAVSLGRRPAGAAQLDLWLAVQDRVLAAARSYGLAAIDGRAVDPDDREALDAGARRAAELGYVGAWTARADHVEPARQAFAG